MPMEPFLCFLLERCKARVLAGLGIFWVVLGSSAAPAGAVSTPRGCGDLESRIPACAYRALEAFYDEDPALFTDLNHCVLAHYDNPYPFFAYALIRFRWGEYYRTVPDAEIEEWLARIAARIKPPGGDPTVQNPASRMAEALYYGLMSLYRSARGRSLPAARAGKKMLHVLKSMEKEYPECPWIGYLRGNYEYFAAQAPKIFRWFSFLFGFPKGHRERGLQLLEQAARRPSMIRVEAIRTLVYIDLFFEHDYRAAREWAQTLIQLHPRNLTHRLFALRAAIHEEDWTDADRQWREWVARAVMNQVPLPDKTTAETMYWRGRWWLHLGGYAHAERWIQSVLKSSRDKPDWLDPWSRLTLAQIYDLTGRRVDAYRLYNDLLRGPDVRGFHRLIKPRLVNGVRLTPAMTNY